MSPKSSLLSPKPVLPPAGSEKIERLPEAQKYSRVHEIRESSTRSAVSFTRLVNSRRSPDVSYFTRNLLASRPFGRPASTCIHRARRRIEPGGGRRSY